MQEPLYKITSDTTNQSDVHEDKDVGSFCFLISRNVSQAIDNSTAIEKIVSDYKITKVATDPVLNPQGFRFTVKTSITGNAVTEVRRNLSEILYAAAYDKGSVSKLSDLFVYKVPSDVEPAFTTPLYLAAHPHINLRFACANDSKSFTSGFANKEYIPWSEVFSKRVTSAPILHTQLPGDELKEKKPM